MGDDSWENFDRCGSCDHLRQRITQAEGLLSVVATLVEEGFVNPRLDELVQRIDEFLGRR
jgi:hypothetical protein